MNPTPDRTALPDGYPAALRTLIRYAIIMAFMGLLVGIALQESAKKLPFSEAGAGLHLEAVLPLALVHGHVFTVGVLLPLALAAALWLAYKTGGRPVGPTALAWLTRGFLPFAALTVALQLFKGYAIILAVRHGQHDMAVVDAGFMGGSHALRAAVYGIFHTGMGVTLGVFLVALWRSMSGRD